MAASRLVFIIQTCISLIVIAFGVSIWFTSTDANMKSVGSGFVAYVLGFWTKGYKSPNEKKEGVTVDGADDVTTSTPQTALMEV